MQQRAVCFGNEVGSVGIKAVRPDADAPDGEACKPKGGQGSTIGNRLCCRVDCDGGRDSPKGNRTDFIPTHIITLVEVEALETLLKDLASRTI